MSLTSALYTMARDRRVPYRVERAIQRACIVMGATERTITQNGLTFRVRRLTSDEDFVTNVVANREYLQHGLSIDHGHTVIDIGGNIGTFAVFAASLGGRVLTVEPDIENLRLLCHNVSANRSAVTVRQGALAPRAGAVTLKIAAAGGGFHTTQHDYTTRTFGREVVVDGVTLAQLLNDAGRCDFLKVDCERAEFDAVAACPIESLRCIRQLAMEYHAPDTDVRTTAMIERLTSAGLRVLHQRSFGAGGHLFMRRH